MSTAAQDEWKYLIPPYLRGLTFDGVKGLFVTRIESADTENILHIDHGDADPRDAAERETVFEACKTLFADYVGRCGRFPDAVRLADGTMYGLGATLEEARKGIGCSRTPDEQGSRARGDVVRDKVVLVTGGAQGFGEGMVRGLVAEGAFAFIADMNMKGAEELADALNGQSGRCVALPLEVDVTSEESVEAMMKKVSQLTGGLDILISNAGVLRAGSVKEMTLSDFNFVTSVDYTGFFICTKFAARMLSVQNSAANGYTTDIIAISSKSGLEGSNKNGAYAGAKFGTIGLTQSFALELVSDAIKVNAICPGNFLDGPLWSDPKRGLFVQYLETGKVPGARTLEDVRRFYEAKVPLNRGCTTEDVLKAVFYCVEQQYETGQAVPVTGGQIMLN